MTPAIQIENLSKHYRVTRGATRYRTLRESLTQMAMAPIRRIRSGGAETNYDDFWALKDVDLKIMPGEVLGLIGRNGAGKSTLLKVLSRITKPTTGKVTLEGRIGSLLEVGTGFHPELTGRENIYLNGAILGMSRREITNKFDEIVDFAEVTQFLDTPVKRYSSGMYVRLAFAVAAHLEPEILLVDEVLAVGDSAFQAKCMGKMGQVARQGRTIVFVSHNMGAVTRLCTRGVWMDRGKVRAVGGVEDLVGQYLSAGMEECGQAVFDPTDPNAAHSDRVRPIAARVRNDMGAVCSSIDVRRDFTVEVEYEILKPTPDLRLGLTIISQDGTVVLNSLDTDEAEGASDRQPGRYASRCRFPANFLNYGRYFVSIGADSPMLMSHFLIHQAISFRIEQTGGIGGHIADGRNGLLRMGLPWTAQKIQPAANGSFSTPVSV